jgi:alpha-N-arabinofuranosidase
MIALALALLAAAAASAPPDVVTVHVGQPGAPIAPSLFGLFIEDINSAADGGLYPERVKNRSFELAEPLMGWSKDDPMHTEGELAIRAEGGLGPRNPHYLRVHAYGSPLTVSNAGFGGMGIAEGAEYLLSAYVRAPSAAAPRAFRVTLIDERGAVIGEAKLAGFGRQWKRYETRLRGRATSAHARLSLVFDQPGELDLDMVSLYPTDTWNNRPNGLRKDLVQLLADMHPGFLRFPGGCIVEGRRLEQRYQWKQTVGEVSERPTLINRWNQELPHRLAPDYFQSFGLGFFEYFQLAEDIGASPLPILNCGMACQFNSSETVPLDRLQPYIQDALDLIEFANGPPGSRWGGLRARMGHPAPFNLKMIGVGNEQWGPRYIERYQRFAAVLKAKHPEITLVSGAGADHEGKEFEYLWSNLRRLKADVVDEHFYMPPAWFLANAGRYDKYDRAGPKLFVGEYAAQSAGVVRPDNHNNWEVALAEAAFMTGLERNADLVVMASYAPMLAHVDRWQWTPNLIWFDSLRSYGTPSYYVQKLFATNLGTRILPVTTAGGGLYTSSSLDEKTGDVIVKMVNVAAKARSVRIALEGAPVSAGGTARLFALSSADLKAENSLDHPTRVAPSESSVAVAGSEAAITVAPRSLTVVRIPQPR